MPDDYSDPGYFERLYERNPDPWQFATSDYERDKYAATVGVLPPGRRFKRCFEVGCSIGVLTRALAERCDALVGVDVSEVALEQARVRCADLPGVEIGFAAVPGTWPEGRFDLIVFSEVLYYLGIAGLHEAAAKSLACLEPGGCIVLVNWQGNTDGACSGAEAARLFIEDCAGRLTVTGTAHEEKYRVDLLS